MAGPGQSKEHYRKEFLQSEVALLADEESDSWENQNTKQLKCGNGIKFFLKTLF